MARARVEPLQATDAQLERAQEELFFGMRIRTEDEGFVEGDKPNLLGRMIEPELLSSELLAPEEAEAVAGMPTPQKATSRHKKTWGFGKENGDE